MSKFWSPAVGRLTPYVPGEQPKINNLTKLNTNENPYGPSPQVLAAIRAATDDGLRLYPDPDGGVLKASLAATFGLDSREVFVGNGSDEVLGLAFYAFFQHGAPVLFPDVTYSFYPVYADLFGIPFTRVPLTDQFTLDMAGYDRPNGGIIFPNPNAPTGALLPLAAIESLLARQPDRVVVVDEAYIDFGGTSAAPLVRRYPNLLVVQTFSKSRSLAGLRVGFALGHPDLIDGLERVKNSFNSYPLDRLALAGATAALADTAYFRQTVDAIIASRQWLAEALVSQGFEVLPSAANFLFVRHPDHDAALLAAGLRERKVLVRHFRQPRIEQFLRITIGTQAECERLVAAFAEIFAPPS